MIAVEDRSSKYTYDWRAWCQCGYGVEQSGCKCNMELLLERVESSNSSIFIYQTSAHTASSIRYLEPYQTHVKMPVLQAVIDAMYGDAA